MKYIIDKEKLIKTAKMFSTSALLFYPIKANTNKRVLDIIDPFISGYEVASIYHLSLLRKKLGIEAQRILYSEPIKSNAHIKKAITMDINCFVIDNIDELKRTIDLAGGMKLKIIIRVDISEFISMHNYNFKWGASIEDSLLMKDLVLSSGHHYLGVSFYIPQEVDYIDNFISVIEGISKTIGLQDCRIIDIGGGLPSDDVELVISKIKEKYLLKNTDFIVEPGRYLLNPCIDLVVKVIDIRIKQGQKLVFIDCGIYSGLMDSIVKKRRFDIQFMEIGYDNIDNTKENCLVCGSTSDISDVLGVYSLPKKIKVGDYLKIYECGAYCSELDTDFCKNKRANYYTVDS